MTGQPEAVRARRRTASAVPGAPAADVASALRKLAEISPYFAADIAADIAADSASGVTSGSAADGTAAVRTEELYRGGTALAAAIDGVNERLGGVERRVAASTLALGHAARLWSVALGCWATAGIIPDLRPSLVRMQPRLGEPVRLIVEQPAGRRVESFADTVDLLHEIVVEDHLRPYFTALRGETRLAGRLLWGNAASALVGSARALAASRHGGRPEPGGAASASRLAAVTRVAAALLATPPLAGTTVHAVTSDGALEISSVVRRSCCLFYRIPGGGTCGDCPLSPTAQRTRG